MRRIALGFALGVLLATAPGGAALAAQPEAAVLTPEQIGVTEPGQGFYPYLGGVGITGPFQQPNTGFFGTGNLIGVGLTASPTTLGTSPVGSFFFTGFSGFPGVGGTTGLNPFILGAVPLSGGSCGVFSLNFCPLYSSTPIQSPFQSGLTGSPFGLGGLGFGTGGPVIIVR